MDVVAEDQEEDLRNRLNGMETKLKRMRHQRNSFTETARRAADSRNSIQDQGKELREKILNLLLIQKFKNFYMKS